MCLTLFLKICSDSKVWRNRKREKLSWLKATSTDSVLLKNTMRMNQSNNNLQNYQGSKVKKTSPIQSVTLKHSCCTAVHWQMCKCAISPTGLGCRHPVRGLLKLPERSRQSGSSGAGWGEDRSGFDRQWSCSLTVGCALTGGVTGNCLTQQAPSDFSLCCTSSHVSATLALSRSLSLT